MQVGGINAAGLGGEAHAVGEHVADLDAVGVLPAQFRDTTGAYAVAAFDSGGGLAFLVALGTGGG